MVSQIRASLAQAPTAERRPHTHEAFGDRREDPWYWLGDPEDQAVIDYLEEENAYTARLMAPTQALQDQLFTEIKARVLETDSDAPVRLGGWWYWARTEEGKQYPIHVRRADADRQLLASRVLADSLDGSNPGEVILDENVLAGDSDYFDLGVWDLSPDQKILAYATDLNGSEKFELRFRDLSTGEDLPDRVAGVYYSSAWSADGGTFFYVRPDDAMRPFQIWRHRIGTSASEDVLVLEELDERIFIAVGLTRSERYVLLQRESKMAGETLYIDAATPEAAPVPILARVEGIEYDADHAVIPGTKLSNAKEEAGEGAGEANDSQDVWLIRSNRPAPDGSPSTNFALWRLPVGQSEDNLELLIPHRQDVKLEGVSAFSDHLVIAERAQFLPVLRLTDLQAGDSKTLEQPEEVYSLLGASNPEWETGTFRFGYTSMVTPPSVIDVRLSDGSREVVKTQAVRDYVPSAYVTRRQWATASDGTRIPISLVHRADLQADGTNPCLLYGYGSYEYSIEPTFSSLRLNLLNRGVVYAIAHIRGGGEGGRRWHEEGRLATKSNTFTDFVSAAEALVDSGWVDRDRIAIRGASAGGLLMGAVTNLRPDLWRAVVAEVPFVDVVTTMSNPELPLTVTEWEEWGNPTADDTTYRRMLAYSPVDNVVATDYPAIYATGGLNDPRVGYWEPTKWVAKIRSLKTDDNPLLLRTEMGAGHGGASGRYDVWRDEARVQAFVLDQLGVD